MVSTAVRVARKSPSPAAAGGVEVHAVGAGLPHALGDEHHVAHRVVDGRHLRVPRLGDAALRHELGPVGDGPVRHRVAAQVRHRAVLQRRDEVELGVLHRLGLVAQDRLDRLVRVVDGEELEHVGAAVALVAVQLVDARAGVEVARAVEAEADLVAHVDGAELGLAREDVEQVVDLRRGEGRRLGAAGADLRAGEEVLADLRRRHLDEPAVAEPRAYRSLHSSTPDGRPVGLVSYITNRAVHYQTASRAFKAAAHAPGLACGGPNRIGCAAKTATGSGEKGGDGVDEIRAAVQRPHAGPRPDRRADPRGREARPLARGLPRAHLRDHRRGGGGEPGPHPLPLRQQGRAAGGARGLGAVPGGGGAHRAAHRRPGRRRAAQAAARAARGAARGHRRLPQLLRAHPALPA